MRSWRSRCSHTHTHIQTDAHSRLVGVWYYPEWKRLPLTTCTEPNCAIEKTTDNKNHIVCMCSLLDIELFFFREKCERARESEKKLLCLILSTMEVLTHAQIHWLLLRFTYIHISMECGPTHNTCFALNILTKCSPHSFVFTFPSNLKPFFVADLYIFYNSQNSFK